MTVFRASENPIIGPNDVKPSRDDFEVIGVFNAGVARYREEIILLLRVAERPVNEDTQRVLTAVFDVEQDRIVTRSFGKDDPENDFSDPRLIVRPKETYLTSISHLRLALSTDGLHFDVDDRPTLTAASEYETFGIEDPRITLLDGTYYISYVAVAPQGVTTCVASTRDFESFHRQGVIFHPENKDVVIFPERIDGRYYALHRPHSPLFHKNDMWVAESPDLMCWGNHRYLMGLREGLWDETRIGAGAVPFRVDGGWLEIYHGADRENRYCLGAVLLDGQSPWKIISRSRRPVFEPEAQYEQAGFFGQVVFTCGLLFEQEMLRVYYGAADAVICYAQIPLADVMAALNA